MTSHRPWPLPSEPWRYYQEWNHTLFLHWKIPLSDLEKLVPADARVDTFDGSAWISLVAFSMENIRPRGLPSIPAISNFKEINVRTYLTKNNKPGVYFLSIEAEKYLSTFLAKLLSGLPYEKAAMAFQQKERSARFVSNNNAKGFHLKAGFTIGSKLLTKSDLDQWLTERYCLYLDRNKNLYSFDIHHLPWELKNVEISNLVTKYHLGNISLDRRPDMMHYSPGVKVLSWSRQLLGKL